MSNIQKLIDMGFEMCKIEHAMKMTSYEGKKPAMEYLLAHADEGETRVSGGSDAGPSGTAAVARSLKCEDCGKIFNNEAEMQYHATKTNHSNFSETAEKKPQLTNKERQAQLLLIEEKLKQKRLEREEHERSDARERERIRIKTGKDMSEARKRIQELEMKEIIDQRKRDKDEEKAARERVRAQIAADKAERKAREQQRNPDSTPTILPSISTPSADLKSITKVYMQTRIQIRLFDGSTLTEAFSINDHLSVVRMFIESKIGNETAFKLMTSFPRKVFVDEDFEQSLETLGLVPTAVLIVAK